MHTHNLKHLSAQTAVRNALIGLNSDNYAIAAIETATGH